MIAVGDLNIAPLETDVWSHKQLLTVVSHTPVEVERLGALQRAGGFVDAVRHFVPPEQRLYTWWSYRNRDWAASDRGRRLDHIWVTPRSGRRARRGAGPPRQPRLGQGLRPCPGDDRPGLIGAEPAASCRWNAGDAGWSSALIPAIEVIAAAERRRPAAATVPARRLDRRVADQHAAAAQQRRDDRHQLGGERQIGGGVAGAGVEMRQRDPPAEPAAQPPAGSRACRRGSAVPAAARNRDAPRPGARRHRCRGPGNSSRRWS